MKKFQIVFALLGLVLVSACDRTGPPADLVVEERPVVYHIVREGQDLEAIARIYNMTSDDLIRLNHFGQIASRLPNQLRSATEQGTKQTPTTLLR